MLKRIRTLAAILFMIATPGAVEAFTVNVVEPSGSPVSGFRWLLEEDNSHEGQPGVHVDVVPGFPELNPLSAGIHASYSVPVASGESAGSSATMTLSDGSSLPPGRYVVSVFPYGDWSPSGTRYTIGGAAATVPDDTSVTVYVTPNAVATGQISVKVFRDVSPLNGTPEAFEPGLEGFSIFIGDAGGDVVLDAFGNKVGTAYLETCDPSGLMPGTGTSFCDVDADGNPDVDQPGAGLVITDANGEARIRFLRPNTYIVEAVPPENESWFQTTGAAARNVIPVSVRPNEPPFLTTFGQVTFHASFGMVQFFDDLGTLPPGSPTTISGEVRRGHLDAPPGTAISPGPAPGTSPCRVALTTASDQTVFVGECADDGTFSITGVPPGSYQLVVFDLFQHHLPVFQPVVATTGGGSIDLGMITTALFFGEMEHYVYLDVDKDGFRDPGEPGLEEQGINLRFRDGTVFQAFPTDTEGFVPFEEVAQFNKFLVAEVDFARFEATGLTTVIDAGGPVVSGPFGEDKRNPQIDPATNLPYKTETGPVLVQAFQQMAGQNSRYEWGKAIYDEDINVPPLDDFPGPGDTDVNSNGEYDNNGGISGIVYYAVTRAEDDPRFAAGEEWEAGIPRVQVNLYRDSVENATGEPAPFGDGTPDDLNANGSFDRADVDNYPFNWAPEHVGPGGTMGIEDVDHNGNGVFDLGDAVEFTNSDSWDDNLPTGCIENNNAPIEIHGITVPFEDCAEGVRLWNQAVPGVFDGGYAFGPGDPLLVPGNYIVEAALPPGLKHVKEEDRNVDFGTAPVPALLPAECVGDPHTVPPLFSFLTASDGTPHPGIDPLDPDNAAPFAGEIRALCDRKKVEVYQGQNAVADFFMFSDVPKSARLIGMTGDGINTTRPGDPNFGIERGLGWLPVAVFDYSEKEIQRGYADEFGVYELLVPSTYDIDLPTPTGVGPAIHKICINHPGPIADPSNPTGPMIADPAFNSLYTTVCFRFEFWAGRTTYAVTPVQRKAGFAGLTTTSLDCEEPDGTPRISQVMGAGNVPAFIDGDGDSFTIDSVGTIAVPNPAFPGDTSPADGFADDPPSEPATITRDFGFGSTEGTVSVGDYTFPAASVTWGASSITVTVPTGAVLSGTGDPESDLLASGQLVVARGDNAATTTLGVTLTIGDTEPGTMTVRRVPLQHATIQDAIDAADADDLILVDPGTYKELLIVTQNIRLQGAGAGTTVIDAQTVTNTGTSPLDAWRTKVEALVDSGDLALVAGQEATDTLSVLLGQEGPGVLVSPAAGVFASAATNARIDGFHIVNGTEGGAVFANTNADRLEVSNNRVEFNGGQLGGAVRVGNSPPPIGGNTVVAIDDFSPNPDVRIHHNDILKNGSLNVGGGVSIYGGATGYEVVDNNICGNYSRIGGGGVGHYGLSDDGLIARNRILFNEVFPGEEVVIAGGGGIHVAGLPAADALGNPIVNPGAGSVVIDRNLIQGNLAGTYDGGGIAALRVNGTDLAGTPFTLDILNNFIVNNVTGLAAGGIALQNTLHANIVHNTIANNASAAVSALAFPAGATMPTSAQVAGVVARAHTPELAAAALSAKTFSDPDSFSKNIIWKNRSMFWDPVLGLLDRAAGPFWDLGVIGDPGALAPTDSVVTDITGLPAGNIAGDPLFVDPYTNSLTTTAAPAEGGSFVQIFMAPTMPSGDYRLGAGSPAIDMADSTTELAAFPALAFDIDGEDRSAAPTTTDRGADEAVGVAGGPLPGAPTADFSAIVVSSVGGDVPLTVNFLDLSTETPTLWMWDFGDGGTSTDQNPVHTYETPGTYDVTLTVSNGVSSSTVTKVGFVVTTAPMPVADFSGTPLTGAAPLTVDFTDLSSGSPMSWAWSFGDSGMSSVQNPSHTYTTPGIYTVSLTVTNSAGTDGETKTAYVSVTGVTADFSADVTTGTAPLTVNFADQSLGSPTGWSWNFGDTGTSSLQNPSHTYTAPGVYTVSLTASDAFGFDVEEKVGYVTVGAPPAQMTFAPLGDARVRSNRPNKNYGLSDPLRVDEDSTSYRSYLKFEVAGLTGPVQSAKLRMYVLNGSVNGLSVHEVSNDFLGTSNPWTETGITWNNAPAITGAPLDSLAAITPGQLIELDVTAAITDNGTVSFGLMGGGDDGARLSSKEGGTPPELVIVSLTGPPPVPTADFVGTPLSGAAPLTVDFTDLSTGSPTAWGWSFGDLETSTVQNPSHTYTAMGTYEVSLTVGNASGTDMETKTGYVTVSAPPAVQTLQPDHDARVEEDEPNRNFGASDPLWVDEDDNTFHSYMKFDIQSLAGTVVSATLRLYAINGSVDGVAVYSVSENLEGSGTAWTESNITWNNAPFIGGLPIDSVSQVQIGTWVELDVTSVIVGNGVVSFGLANDGDDSARFNSKEGANKPELVIESQ